MPSLPNEPAHTGTFCLLFQSTGHNAWHYYFKKEISAVVYKDVALSISGVNAKALPKSPEKFFQELSRFVSFGWRENGKTVEIAVFPGNKGFWTGHRGSRVLEYNRGLIKDFYSLKGSGILDDLTVKNP